MTQSVSLSLPLSATALRLGAALLTDLAAQADTIYAELTGANPFYRPSTSDANVQIETYVAGLQHEDGLGGVQDIQPEQFGTSLEQDVQTAEADTGIETPEQRQYRLHGNVASAGMEPAPVITQETLPPVEYETVVTYEDVPEKLNGLTRGDYIDARWTLDQLVEHGYVLRVETQVAKPDAPGASVAPLAPAPAPAPVAPAASGSGVAVDKDGLPWDSRIHSEAAEKMSKAGTWKTRKNLPDGYKAQIEAEIRAVMNAGKPTDPNVVTGAPVPGTATTATAALTPAAPPAPSAAPAPAPSLAPVAPVAAPAGNVFAEFTRWLVGHTKAGKLSQTDAVLEIQKQGLTQIPDLAKRPDLIPAVMAALTAAKGL